MSKADQYESAGATPTSTPDVRLSQRSKVLKEGQRILVVEDCPSFRKLAVRRLTDEGYHVHAAADGEEALRMAETLLPDLIILDVDMPVMDGFAACRKLKESPFAGDTPVVFISSDESTGQILRGFAHGGVDYIAKSAAPEELMARVRVHLEMGNLQRALQRNLVQAESSRELLSRANTNLRRRNTELSEFTHVASRDLQEPVRKLISFSKLLRRDLGENLPERAAKDLDFITEEAERMRILVKDLLALQRAGQSTMRCGPVALADCVAQAVDVLTQSIGQTGAEIICESLPEVTGDAALLTQLYQNLIDNALKFTVPGRKPSVRLTAKNVGGAWVMQVQDNGIGIKPEFAEEIFAPFKRLHGRGEYPGSGIGLAVCRTNVERHGGRIWVESGEHGGAVFSFMIPQLPASRSRRIEECVGAAG